MRQPATENRTRMALVLLILATTLVVLSQRAGGVPLRNLLSNMLVPAQTWISERLPLVLKPGVVDLSGEDLNIENNELAVQVAQLQNEIARLREAEAERDMLSELLQFAHEHREHSYLAAEVIGRDPSPFLYFLILNKGTVDGVERGLSVVSSKGLVGLITEATPRASQVLLITDPTMAVNVRLQESRADGVLVGQAAAALRLKFLSMDANVESGNTVVTSGMGGTFPSDILVGTVASVRRRLYEVFQEAEVAPAVDFSRLEIVLIITNFVPNDLEPLLSETEVRIP